MTERKSVYHEGELAVQELAGERELAERHGSGIQGSIMPGAVKFLERQQLLALASGAPEGQVWVSVWFGSPGFAHSRDEGQTLAIDLRRALALEVDPLQALLKEGSRLGVLAIELETRRRLRVNGTVRAVSAAGLELAVQEAFPNCPKYIAKRVLALGRASAGASPMTEGTQLDEARVATISRTDTLFVGSLHPERGADASHRGGEPGFVRVVDQQTLRIPDYSGNGMYQTLGNLHSTGRAGLVFLDFDGQRLLHVTGRTALRFDQPEATLTTGGTGRSWDLHIERWLEGALPAGVEAALLERSRFNPKA